MKRTNDTPQCCTNRFNDDVLKDLIRKKGTIGRCDFCGAKNVHCILPEDLSGMFAQLVAVYEPRENYLPMEFVKETEGEFLWEKFRDEWNLFAFDDYEKQMELTRAIVPEYAEDCVGRAAEFYGELVSEELQDRWKAFCDEIKCRNRYFPQTKFDTERIAELLPLLEETIKEGSHLFRARPCERRRLQPSDMGKPPPEQATGGRANPVGIPYLYLASDWPTAIAEVKPSLREKVTVGDFLVTGALRMANLRRPRVRSPFVYDETCPLTWVLDHLDFLRLLGIELSRTVHPSQAQLTYIPCQFLCEFIKNANFDGVAYGSAMGKGYNVAIFTDGKLKCVSTELYEVKSVKIVANVVPQGANEGTA